MPLRVENDHRHLVCKIALQKSKGSAPQRRRAIKYDKDSFSDPIKSMHFEKLVSEMPAIDIDVDNSSHCYLVDEYIRESLETCLPLPKSIKKKEFISDSTFALILHGHGLAKLMRKSDRCFDKTLLLAIFGFWAHHARASAMVYLETRKHLHSRIKYDTCYGFNKKSNLIKYIHTRQKCKVNVQSVKSLVAFEKLACIDIEADIMKAQFDNNDIIGMHKSTGKIVKFAGKQKTHKTTRVFNDAGVPSQTYEEEGYAFREYFCKLMKGKGSIFEEVVVKDRTTSSNKYSGLDFDSCWRSIPSPTDVANMK